MIVLWWWDPSGGVWVVAFPAIDPACLRVKVFGTGHGIFARLDRSVPCRRHLVFFCRR